MVISKHSLSPQHLQLGTEFTFSITAKNNSGKAATSYYLEGFVQIALVTPDGLAAGYRYVTIAREDYESSWANGASKTLTVSGAVTSAMWNRLKSIKLLYPDANIHENDISWEIWLYGSDHMGIDDIGVMSGTLGGNFYNMTIEAFSVERCLNGAANDEGENISVHTRLSMDTDCIMDRVAVKLHYAENAQATTDSPWIDLTAEHRPNAVSGVMEKTSMLEQTFSNISNWSFLLSFEFGADESAQARTTAPRAFANLHLSGASTGGAAFGGFSTATEDNPLFECHYPAKFYGGIDGVTTYTTGEAKLNATCWSEGTVKWYKYGRMVMVVCRDLKPNAAKMPDTWTAYVIATGLPEPVTDVYGIHVLPDRFDYGVFLSVNSVGTLNYHQRNIVASDVTGNKYLHASFCYISAS